MAEMKEDRQHLLGVSSLFASQTDLLLCVRDDAFNQEWEFPVHRIIMSAHSPVLSDLLQSTLNQPQAQQSRLPMVDDCCWAVCSALNCIYRDLPLPEQEEQAFRAKRQKSLTPSKLACTPGLEHAPLCCIISSMEFCDKYSMTRVAKLTIQAAMAHLHEWAQLASIYPSKNTQILDCITVAEVRGLLPMLAICEALIICHFTDATQVRDTETATQLITSKLSTVSMLRIAQGRMHLQDAKLNETVAEGKRFNAQVNDLLQQDIHSKETSVLCPRCTTMVRPAPGQTNLTHAGTCQCKKQFNWPDMSHHAHPTSMHHILWHMASVHKVPFDAISGL